MNKEQEQSMIYLLEVTQEWRDVVGYEGLYRVSEYGEVISLHKGKKKLMTPQKNRDGYYQIGLSRNGSKKTCRINRLVAEAFIPNPEGLDEVNHLDEVRDNNHYTNLEWVSHKQNIQYSAKSRKDAFKKKPVYCQELDMTFDSVYEAAAYVDGKSAGLSACLNGARNTHRGYHFEYVA